MTEINQALLKAHEEITVRDILIIGDSTVSIDKSRLGEIAEWPNIYKKFQQILKTSKGVVNDRD